jgi:hypothetical protein
LQKKLGEKSTSLEKQWIQCKLDYKKEPKAKSKKKNREARAKQELDAKNETKAISAKQELEARNERQKR